MAASKPGIVFNVGRGGAGEPHEILQYQDPFPDINKMCGCVGPTPSRLLKDRELAPVKRSDFKAMVVPIVKQEFDVALRCDLVVDGRSGQRGWKNVRLQA